MIRLPVRDDEERLAWNVVLDLASLRVPWTMIGAQMVALHAYENERPLPRISRDYDLLVNVRVVQDGTERLSRTLADSDFELADPSPAGVAHRFRRDGVAIDVLAPDGIGSRASTTTIPPARTVRVPGGSQALSRTEHVEVEVADRRGRVPRPSLLGAILVKARAIAVSDAPDSQRQDLGFLLSLVADPRAMKDELKPSERGWLRGHPEMLEPSALLWAGVRGAEDARAAFVILSGLRP